MITKKFTKLQEDLIKTCCDSNLPIFIVGKPENGLEQIIDLIDRIRTDRLVFNEVHFDQSILGNSFYLEDLDLRAEGLSMNHKIVVMNINNPRYAKIKGNFIKIFFFSKDDTEEVHLKITDVSTQKSIVTINLPKEINTILIYNKSNQKMNFNNYGRTISLTEPAMNIETGDVYLNTVEQLELFVKNQESVLAFYSTISQKFISKFESVVIVDLRDLQLDPQSVAKEINKLLDIMNKLKKKVAVITSGAYLMKELLDTAFDKKSSLIKM